MTLSHAIPGPSAVQESRSTPLRPRFSSRIRARFQPCHNLPFTGPALAAEGRLDRRPKFAVDCLPKPVPSPFDPNSGLTLVELIIVIAILSVLAGTAVPIARFQVKRSKERELRRDLWQMRDAIDHYKDAAEKGAFQTKLDSFNYPPDLQTLVDGVEAGTKKVRFLRKIPVDPMTGQPDWAVRSMQDDPDSDSAGGQNVFDIHSKSTNTALDGTKYNTW